MRFSALQGQRHTAFFPSRVTPYPKYITFLPTMSGGGEVRVLRQEAGQESPTMPAWKREILERRKAKGGGSGAGAAEPCPSASSSRVNGEVTGNSSASKKDNETNADSVRNYTITAASQHFAGKRGSSPTSPELSPVKTNKDPLTATDPYDSEKTLSDGEGQESLVLQDSLGPLQENPFIKLEKERKKRQDRENAIRPVQHILELYGSVPGIRTIRAENIIIIESDPDYFTGASGIKSGFYLQQNGLSSYSSLNDLLDRRAGGVTEIRAKEVVIYDTTLSRSEENLSTLGHPCHEGAFETGEGQGRVSRMLQKFDSNYRKLQPKSRSTENLLDLETSSSRPRQRPKPQPDLVPKYKSHAQPSSLVRTLGNTQSSSSVLPSSQSSKPNLQLPLYEPDSTLHSAGPPQSVSSYRQRFEVSGGHSVVVNPREEAEGPQTKPFRERDWESTEVPPKSKVPCSPDTCCARAESPASPTTPLMSPPSPGFEIRPSPRPDLSQLPSGDIQARALANLRLQSRNSFTVFPKRHRAASSPGSTVPSSPIKFPPSQRVAEMPTPGVPIPITPPPTPAASKRKEEVRAARPTKPDPPPPTATLPPSPSPAPSPVPSVQSPPPEDAPADQLPVTNIDDIDVDPLKPVAPSPTPVMHGRKGNTFTVVPKRKSEPQPDSQEPQEPSGGAQTPPTPSQAPYAQLGSLLKKRYPAVEEIEVIGGYQSLGRSCLIKTGSTGKKLKISFKESSLQSSYEYPSESSVWDSEEEEEEDDEEAAAEGKGGGQEEDQPSMVGRIHIPRPSYTSNGTDLSSYIPKHTVDFNSWQEHKLDDPVYQGDTNFQRTQMSGEVMLIPADSSSLSDFRSEPALYF
ncbi:taperin-like [Salvelinus sp. IW2-2015]|uniref:taperin-like n=1 Tax=Salvelinus sp. IW2-2015 TaxID=2691554 RepID=UPI000CDF8398|nr:taperin-like [Salvelinus alpinus]